MNRFDANRINFLDGLRGIAILLVIHYHLFARWPQIVPYGNKYADFPLFTNGYLGVQLFFLISGFVILMSIRKSESFFLFIFKRWSRLFPAMLFASTIIYLSSFYLVERPAGAPHLHSIIPGLFFVEPGWIELLTGIHLGVLEKSFWSLFVEVKFYIIFGLMYYLFGETKAILGLVVLYLLSFLLYIHPLPFFSSLSSIFSFEYFGLFAAGCLAYVYYCNKRKIYLFYYFFILTFELYKVRCSYSVFLILLLLIFLFIIPVLYEKTRKYFSNNILMFLGFISYPLYLIHENALISLICKLYKFIPLIPDFLLPVLPLIIVMCVAYFIANNMEPWLSRLLRRIYR